MTKQQQKMIELLEKYYHNITKSCKEAGITTTTHYDWLAKFADYKKASEEAKNGLIDRAEEILHNKFEDDTTALIFFLKCKGGYSEKKDDVVVEVKNMPVEFISASKSES